MDDKEKKIEELKAKNDKLRRQFSVLLDGYAKLEITDLQQNIQAANQKRLIDFVQRIAGRLDDDDLIDVMVEEFLIELSSDRVSYILPGSGPSPKLAVSNEAVEKGIKRLPLPYFIAPETDKKYIDMVYECLDSGDLVVSRWDTPVAILPDSTFQLPMEQNFQVAMEEEFNVVPKIDFRASMAFPIKTTVGGASVICLQRTSGRNMWSQPQQDLFRDMCRYAALLLEQTQLTQHIRDLKDQLSSLIQSMPSAIIGFDLLGTVTMWGGRAEDFFDISEEDALGNVFWNIVPQYKFISSAMMDVISMEGSGGLNFDEIAYRKEDNSLVYHNANLFTMFGSNRGEVALRVDNVTEQVQLNHQLFHAQRMETVGTLAGGLAHDFNNVLGGIVGTLSLMKQRTKKALEEEPDNSRAAMDIEDMDVIETCTVRASDMVKRLLALSRKLETKMEEIDLNAIIKNAVTLCKASFESRIKIKYQLPEKKLFIVGDKTQLEQVVLNICVNARDAMKNEGTLILRLSEYLPTDKFREKNPRSTEPNLIRIQISDTGEGIPLEDMDRIFDPFFTTKSQEQGTGLGLSIVDNIMKDHKGYLDVESEKGMGTTFSLFFRPAGQVNMEDVQTSEDERMQSGEILVVDDDELLRKTTSRMLFELGYTVATAANGAAALKMCDSGLNFDLIVMDVDMPVMSGIDTVRMIRKSCNFVPVLFSSNRQQQYQLQGSLKEDNTWMITKPYNFNELNKAVKEALKKEPQ